MSQDYTIKDVRKGRVEKDSYGNELQSYALSVSGHGEPVKLVRSSELPAPKVGDVIFGMLTEFEAGGKTYYKLQPTAKPAPQPMTKDEVIKSEWAIGQAVQVWIGQGCLPEAYDNIEKEAQHFYKMINNIRGEQ
jgi:hypothetical protein